MKELDLKPACDRARKTQHQWIDMYNTQAGEFKNKRMIASSDIIRAPGYASREAFESLQNDFFVGLGIVLSTRNSYERTTLAGKVIHNYQSSVVRPKAIFLEEIPVLNGEDANDVVKINSGLLYARALADDEYAKPADLLKRLVALTQREPRSIWFYTPNQSSRALYTETAVGLIGEASRFYIGGCGRFDELSMRTRGIALATR